MAKKTMNVPQLHNTKFEPFKVLEMNGNFQITIGNAIISEKKFKNKKDAEAYLASKPYTIIINAACYCMEHAQKQIQNETQQNNAEPKENA